MEPPCGGSFGCARRTKKSKNKKKEIDTSGGGAKNIYAALA